MIKEDPINSSGGKKLKKMPLGFLNALWTLTMSQGIRVIGVIIRMNINIHERGYQGWLKEFLFKRSHYIQRARERERETDRKTNKQTDD